MMNLFENLQAMNEENEFNQFLDIDDVWDGIRNCKSLEEIKEIIGEIPSKFGIFDYEQITPDFVRVTNTYYDSNTGEDIIEDEDIYIGNDKDLEENKKLVESPELRTMTNVDSWGWQGANDFRDGSKPLLADGEYATLVICGPDTPDEEDCANVGIYYGEDDDEHWAQKTYDTKEDAVKDSKLILKLLDDEIDEKQLQRFGFEIIT